MASTTTNLGLTKPAYTDSADVAVINSNMDILDTKIGAIGNTSVASQIGTLSEQIATYSFGDKTVSALETALDTFCASMTDGEYKHVWVHITTASGIFSATNYTGFVECNLSTRWNVLLAEQASGRTIRGYKTSSGWNWKYIPTNPYEPNNMQNDYNAVFDDLGNTTSSRYDIMNSGAANRPYDAVALCFTTKRYANASTTLGIQTTMAVNGEIYKRFYLNGTWSAWQRLALNSEKLDNSVANHTISLIGDASFVGFDIRATNSSDYFRLNFFDNGKVSISRYAGGAWRTEVTLRNAD